MHHVNPRFAERLRRLGHDVSRSQSPDVIPVRLVRPVVTAMAGGCAGLVLAALLWLDFALFETRAQVAGREHGVTDYLALRLGSDSARTETRITPPVRDYAAQPLTLREKAAYVGRLSAVLPPARPGWVLRPFEPEDMALLRPDLAQCSTGPVRIDGDTFYNRDKVGTLRCPLVQRWSDFWVYARGDERIAVLVHYQRPRDIGAFVCMPRMIVASPIIDAFGAHFAQRAYQPATAHQGWRFGRLPGTERVNGGVTTRMPLRLMGRKAGDGAATIFVMANTPRSDVMPVLDRLHYDLLGAMVAPR